MTFCFWVVSLQSTHNKFLQHFLSEKNLYFSFPFEELLYWTQNSRSVGFFFFKYFLCIAFSSCLHGFWWEVWFLFLFLYRCFFVVVFSDLSKYLSLISWSLNIICLGIHFWYLSELFVSEICCLSIIWGDSQMLFLKIYLLFLLFFLFVFPLHIHYTFWNWLTVLGYFVLKYFYLLLSFESFYQLIFILTDSFHSYVQSGDEPINDILHLLHYDF